VIWPLLTNLASLPLHSVDSVRDRLGLTRHSLPKCPRYYSGLFSLRNWQGIKVLHGPCCDASGMTSWKSFFFEHDQLEELPEEIAEKTAHQRTNRQK
jgi:hypothetical protein